MFVWWTAGLHRLPYLCFLSLALYHYVRYRDQHRSRDALGVVVSLTLALGFFEKGLLIPLFLVGVEACHWRTTPPAARKKNALFLGGLILFVAVYFQIWRHAVGEQWSTVVTGPRFLFDYTKVSWTVLLRGTVGRVDDGTGIAIAVWVVILGAAVLRARTALAAVLVGFVSVSLSLVVTGLSSNRSAVFGLNLPVLNQRYYPDAMFVLALFAAIAWQQGATSGDASASVAVRRREWAVTIVLVGGMIVGALTSYGVSTWRTALAYPAQARTRAFLQTLNGELLSPARRWNAAPLRAGQGPTLFSTWDSSTATRCSSKLWVSTRRFVGPDPAAIASTAQASSFPRSRGRAGSDDELEPDPQVDGDRQLVARRRSALDGGVLRIGTAGRVVAVGRVGGALQLVERSIDANRRDEMGPVEAKHLDPCFHICGCPSAVQVLVRPVVVVLGDIRECEARANQGSDVAVAEVVTTADREGVHARAAHPIHVTDVKL